MGKEACAPCVGGEYVLEWNCGHETYASVDDALEVDTDLGVLQIGMAFRLVDELRDASVTKLFCLMTKDEKNRVNNV